MDLEDHLVRRMGRRDALVTLGGLGAGGLVIAACGGGGAAAAPTTAAAAATCVLTPEATEGPYWVPNHLTRRDIRAGQLGTPLQLALAVQDVRTCRAIAGADVELWHANATGIYSGVQGNTARFLRGHQKTNARGLASFLTVYPGWYRGRTPHIHVKVHVGGQVVHTGQLFMPDAISSAVYRTGRYRSRGTQDTRNASDMIYRQAGGSRARMRLVHRRAGGYTGSITMAVAT